MQDCSPSSLRQGGKPEFRPDRAAGKRASPACHSAARFKGWFSMMRLVLSSLRAVGLAVAAASVLGALAPALAEATTKPAKKDDASKPALVASFGDWNVFVGQAGKGRICYTLAQPKTREPASLKRDPGYAFISDRPTEGVRNEVSFIMGFDIAAGADNAESKPDAKPAEKPAPKSDARKSDAKPKTPAAPDPVASVDEAEFEMLPKGGNLWVKNAAREGALIAEMRKGTKLVIKAASLRGHESTDTYSLAGFAQAMERLQKECPGK
jgi:invasion protein IalB